MPKKTSADQRPGAGLAALLGGTFWSMRPDALPRMFSLAQTLEHMPQAAEHAAQTRSMVEAAPEAPEAGGVAVISLTGVLTPYGSFLSFLFGGSPCGVQGFRDDLAAAVNDPTVSAIVLDVDSPGGLISLIPEAAAEVRAARDVKPVYAVANVQAASAAYYIASQATKLYVTPSGTVGSVGVYYVHEDFSGLNQQRGIDVSYIYAGEYKVEGNSDEPLSDDARTAWQADADTLYAQFLADVAAGRGTTAEVVQANYGKGRVLLAQDALAAGMVDGVATIQTVVAQAFADSSSSSSASARRIGRAEVLTPNEVRLQMGFALVDADDEEIAEDEDDETPDPFDPDHPEDPELPDPDNDDDDVDPDDHDEDDQPGVDPAIALARRTALADALITGP